jgi:hypothetical protein
MVNVLASGHHSCGQQALQTGKDARRILLWCTTAVQDEEVSARVQEGQDLPQKSLLGWTVLWVGGVVQAHFS